MEGVCRAGDEKQVKAHASTQHLKKAAAGETQFQKDYKLLYKTSPYDPLCPSAGRLVGRSVGLSVMMESFTSYAPIGALVSSKPKSSNNV